MTEPIASTDAAPAQEPLCLAQRALAAPVTVNRAARTVEVVWEHGCAGGQLRTPLGPIIKEYDLPPSR
jgi:hypothetical protein